MALKHAPACGYPQANAARVALKTVKEYLEAHPEIERMRFVLLGKAGHAVNEAARIRIIQ